MKKLPILITITCCMLLFSSCVTQMALNAVSNVLAPSSSASEKEDSSGMMTTLTGESDPILMAGFFPTALKMYEVLYTQNPKHYELGVMTGSLYVMYANAFIQHNAALLPIEQFDKQNSEFLRAKFHYLRGRDYVLQALDTKYKGFKEALMSANSVEYDKALASLKKEDVNAAYWAGAGWLGAFSVDPLDADMLRTVAAAVAMLEKAASLEVDYNDGAIWDILCAFYAAAPGDLGGSFEKALYAHEQSLIYSKGQSISVYITAATSLAVPRQDSALFDESLKKALAIDVNVNPANRLAAVIAREKALWLQEHRGDYFIEW